MPWTAPRTWVTNEIVTAALLNTHVRDNLDWLGTPPFAIATLSSTTSAGVWTGPGLTGIDSEGLTVTSTQFTVVRAGIYLLTMHAAMGATTVVRGARILHAGATIIGQDGTDTTGRTYAFAAMVTCNAADALNPQVFSATGSEAITGRYAAYWLRDP